MGFPGETEEDFEILYNFVKDMKFDSLGTFTYSKEEGTKSYFFDNQVEEEIKIDRYNKIMELQSEISLNNNQNKIGEVSYGLIVGYDEEENAYLIRGRYNAPDDIDGNIYAYCEEELELGQKVKFEIIDASTYDLYAKIIIE